MTPPDTFVLLVALVCSVVGTTLERSADHRATSKMADINQNSENKNNYQNKEMKQHRTNNTSISKVNSKENIFDDIYTETEVKLHSIEKYKFREFNNNIGKGTLRQYNDKGGIRSKVSHRRVKRDDDEAKCERFSLSANKHIYHPVNRDGNNNYYANSTDCVLQINGTEGTVVQLTFVDIFHIEDHPDCAYDYLEIRDGHQGYFRLLGKVCGEAFPSQITSSGPHLWLKFHSDDTIEYEGFDIKVDYIPSANSHTIPESCYKTLDGMHGVIDSSNIDKDCIDKTSNQALDFLWTIKSPENTKIYLNFTTYSLARPNECEDNVVQVFGSVLESEARLAHYCGSMANSVTTKIADDKTGKGKAEKTNLMYVRLFATKAAKNSAFNATFTAFRSLDPSKDEKCDENSEFDCEDNTCIALELKCDKYAHCRLKADEDTETTCKGASESMINQPHIMVILVIFSLILSGMSFVFLFKCARKLYQDHKIIKEHIRQSCEDRLDNLVASRLTLDAKQLQMDNEPRASLERDNHTNEMFKQQRKLSQHKQPTSIDSDFIQETQLDLEEEPWRREVDSVPDTEAVRVERNGRSRKSDFIRKEQSIRSKREREESVHSRRIEEKERKEIRDASVGAPDTKESSCQTRESLFQTGTAPSSDGTESTTNSRGFSTFGYSGATIARPSPPAPGPSPPAGPHASQITIELLRTVPQHQDPVKIPKKISDRRPMSTETTRSAPDVIIVSKPIR